MSSSYSESGGANARERVGGKGSCRAGTVAGGPPPDAAVPRDSQLLLPQSLRNPCHRWPGPWPAGTDTTVVRTVSCVPAWAGVAVCPGAAVGAGLQLPHGANQTCLTLQPALPGGGRGEGEAAWGLEVGRELGEWAHGAGEGLGWQAWA